MFQFDAIYGEILLIYCEAFILFKELFFPNYSLFATYGISWFRDFLLFFVLVLKWNFFCFALYLCIYICFLLVQLQKHFSFLWTAYDFESTTFFDAALAALALKLKYLGKVKNIPRHVSLRSLLGGKPGKIPSTSKRSFSCTYNSFHEKNSVSGKGGISATCFVFTCLSYIQILLWLQPKVRPVQLL